MKIINRSHKILAVIITILSLTSILITVNAATSADFPVEVTDGTYTFRFATHTGSGTEGNWIELTGGSDITLPEITLYYNGITSADYDKGVNNVVVDADTSIVGDSVTYPYSTHPLYSTTQTITYTFNGRTSHAGLPVDVKLIKVDDPLDFESAASDAFRGDTQAIRDILTNNDPNNVVVQTKSGSLDGSGDISNNFGTQAAGDYIIAVMSQAGNTFILYSATPVEVLDRSLTITMDAKVYRGDDLDIDITLTGPDATHHIYGAALIKESAYYANAQIISYGSTDDTELTVNGATLIEGSGGSFSLFGGGLGNIGKDEITDFMSQAFESDEYAVAFSTGTTATSYTLSVTTNGLAEDDYVVLVGAWDGDGALSSNQRLQGFTQDSVYVDIRPSGGGGYTPPPLVTEIPTPEELEALPLDEALAALEDLDADEIAELLEEVSDGKTGEILGGLPASEAAEILENLTGDKAVNVIEAMDRAARSNVLTETDPEYLAGLMLNISGSVVEEIISDLNATDTARILEAADTPEELDKLAEAINNIDEDKAAEILLETGAEVGAQLVEAMADKDLNKAAKRVEAAVKMRLEEVDPEKRQELLDKVAEILENVSTESLVDLFVEIANLPETPSTVADVFEAMNKTKVLDVITAWVNVGDLEELGMVFGYLTEDTIEELWMDMAPAEREALYPYLNDETKAALPQLGEFTVTSLTVEPETVEPGDIVTIEAIVENIGDEADSTTVKLYVDDVETASEAITLDPSESITLEWTTSKDMAGQYTVEVMGESATFTVETPLEPAEFTLSNLQVSPSTVEPGEDVTVTLTVKNTGELSGSYSADIMLDGETVETASDTLDGGASDTVSVTVSSEEEGTHTVTADGLEAQFSVEAPPAKLNWMYIVLIVVAALAITGYLYMRRK